jgi:hypothetical protein
VTEDLVVPDGVDFLFEDDHITLVVVMDALDDVSTSVIGIFSFLVLFCGEGWSSTAGGLDFRFLPAMIWWWWW